jgi:NitT/TauT family transport system permease protein
LVRAAIGVGLVLVGWWVVADVSGVSERSFPRPLEVITRTLSLCVDAEFLLNVLATLKAAALGMVITVPITLLVGIVLGSSYRAYNAASALMNFVRPIPVVALIPAAVLLFGSGIEFRVALVVFAAFWLMLYNVISAIRDVDPLAKDTARMFGFGPLGVLWHVSLPSAMPFVFTGVRIAATAALMVAIAGEIIVGGSRGLGTWIVLYQSSGVNQVMVFAGAAFAGFLGLVINFALVALERTVLPWAHRYRDR